GFVQGVMTSNDSMSEPLTRKRIGLIGARGYTGAELIRLLAAHPRLELVFVSSRELGGQRVAEHVPEFAGALRYENLDAAAATARGADAVILALPNGKAAPYVAAIDAQAPRIVIVDLSADHRFDDAWYYGLPELTRARYAGSAASANPG
ncbi:N-acetyl-gamma-glutamyl-phosphate reductase, partial [mine drainage metagenome]